MHTQSTNSSKPLVLRPRVGELAQSFLSTSQLNEIISACGSPVNVLFPQVIASNISSFNNVLNSHGLTGSLHFAHKANQSDSLLRQMAVCPINADVASLEELRHALACGFAGTRLEATGPKNAEFLCLCLLHGVTINVDSLQELENILVIRERLGHKDRTRILLRICGFTAGQMSKESRFGIRLTDVRQVLDILTTRKDAIHLLGFSFHLDSTSIDERLVAIEKCLALFADAIDLGLQPSVLNIGGGFRVNYLAEEEDWNRYTSVLKQAAVGTHPKLTWQNNLFGLSNQEGMLRGQLNSYGYFEPTPGANFLQELLSSPLPNFGNQTVGSVLAGNMIELWIEPGRSILDQAGITLARVNDLKTSSHGDTLVALNMKRQDIAFLDQEIFVDPLLVTKRSSKSKSRKGDHASVYLTGNLCLESDLIFRRKVNLQRLPQPGDILAFVNTAAYMMDFSATNSIMQGQAVKVAAIKEGRKFTWMLDSKYSPVWDFYRRT